MKFPELKDLLFELSDEIVFQEKMRGFLDYHDPHSTGPEAHLGKTTVFERDIETSQEFQVTVSFDKHIYDLANNTLSRLTEIYKSISHEKKGEQLRSWINDLEIAIKLVGNNAFYKDFPLYRKSLDLASKRLLRLIEELELRKKKRGNPGWKGLSIPEKARVISYARELLYNDPEKYRPRAGAEISDLLKIEVAEGLMSEIPGINKYKVERVLQKYLAHLKMKK